MWGYGSCWNWWAGIRWRGEGERWGGVVSFGVGSRNCATCPVIPPNSPAISSLAINTFDNRIISPLQHQSLSTASASVRTIHRTTATWLPQQGLWTGVRFTANPNSLTGTDFTRPSWQNSKSRHDVYVLLILYKIWEALFNDNIYKLVKMHVLIFRILTIVSKPDFIQVAKKASLAWNLYPLSTSPRANRIYHLWWKKL